MRKVRRRSVRSPVGDRIVSYLHLASRALHSMYVCLDISPDTMGGPCNWFGSCIGGDTQRTHARTHAPTVPTYCTHRPTTAQTRLGGYWWWDRLECGTDGQLSTHPTILSRRLCGRHHSVPVSGRPEQVRLARLVQCRSRGVYRYVREAGRRSLIPRLIECALLAMS